MPPAALRVAIHRAVVEEADAGKGDLAPHVFFGSPPRTKPLFMRRFPPARALPPALNPPPPDAGTPRIATPVLLRAGCPRVGALRVRTADATCACPTACRAGGRAPALWPNDEAIGLVRPGAYCCCPAACTPLNDDAAEASLRCGRAHAGGHSAFEGAPPPLITLAGARATADGLSGQALDRRCGPAAITRCVSTKAAPCSNGNTLPTKDKSTGMRMAGGGRKQSASLWRAWPSRCRR